MPNLNQKEINDKLLKMLQELLSIVAGQGYAYDTSLEDCPHSAAKTSKRLHILSKAAKDLEEEIK